MNSFEGRGHVSSLFLSLAQYLTHRRSSVKLVKGNQRRASIALVEGSGVVNFEGLQRMVPKKHTGWSCHQSRGADFIEFFPRGIEMLQPAPIML